MYDEGEEEQQRFAEVEQPAHHGGGNEQDDEGLVKSNKDKDNDNDNGVEQYASNNKKKYACDFLCIPFWLWLWIRRLLVFLIFFFASLAITGAYLSSADEAVVPALKVGKNAAVVADDTHKILIIGAGAAGLYAGYALQYMGITNFEILEASYQFGGRTLEMDDFVDVPLDLGAEWIHVQPKILKDLLLFDQGVTTLPETMQYRPRTYATQNGPCCNWVRFFYSEFKFRKTTWFQYLNQFFYPYVANNIVLNAIVETIDYSNADAIAVTTRDGQVYTANQIIIATPISILQNEDIEFVPPLPEKKVKAMNKVEMAPGLKVWMEFDQDFYPDTVYPGRLIPSAVADKLYFDSVWGKPTEKHVLTLFEVGWQAEPHIDLTDQEIVDDALSQLDSIFDGQATKHYLQHSRVQNWSKLPFIQGAYSYDEKDWVDQVPTLKALAGDGRIYFAGEYLGLDDVGTVHGAALTGREVAQRLVLDHYAPSSSL